MRGVVIAALAALAACAAVTHQVAGASLELNGTHWMRVDDDDASPHFPTLDFSTEGASGYAGCNHWFARVETAGNQLRFKEVGSTRMMCPPPAMAAERNMLGALARTRAARRQGEGDDQELILLDERDEIVARFTRADGGS